ncbi:hypothetical protein PISMIDRAFT_669920 [Pisolithus microcarpus 441]|uniref:Uncharacterized protein n=1 Tax=Pisolithus microcarpus 441 TaxID=765257 RepID=A0A0C9Z0J9_9AGAM|nr:hypothetical protein PISMIDRAFT_669920 [Pisolithus microcarpus 441]
MYFYQDDHPRCLAQKTKPIVFIKTDTYALHLQLELRYTWERPVSVRSHHVCGHPQVILLPHSSTSGRNLSKDCFWDALSIFDACLDHSSSKAIV